MCSTSSSISQTTAWILISMIGIAFCAPPQYCVEETKNRRLVGAKPYAEAGAKDARRCISRCIKDQRDRLAPCRAVVYGQLGGSCRRYLTSASSADGLASLQRTSEHEGVAYYELLAKCPKQNALVSQLDTKRRDDVEDQQIEEPSRPIDGGSGDQGHGPPGVMPPGMDPPPNSDKDETVEPDPIDTETESPPQEPEGNGKPKFNANQRAKDSITNGALQYQNFGGQPNTVETRPYPVQPQARGCCAPPQASSCCPPPQPQPCCPAPQPQPCCAAPQPQPCCPAPQPVQQCCQAPQPQPCCPAPQPCCPTQPPPPEWGPWSAWTDCQQLPCAPGGAGGTVQTRTRQCIGQGSCIGEAQQQQPCGCLQGQWTEWGPPSPCSCTCGDGIQSRRRSCTVPGTCQGNDMDQSPCNQGPCAQWGAWAQLDPCPVTCGQGMTQRRRQCTDGRGGLASGCPGPDARPEQCQPLQPCCQPWSPWSQCSSTCGQGVQARTMTCDGGPGSREQQPCQNPTPCCTEWSQWGGCQVVCGQGYQSRTRQCDSSVGGGGAVATGYHRAGGHQLPAPNPGVGHFGVMGNPTLPNNGNGCCNTQQQQACSVGCSPNSFYSGGGGRRKRLAPSFNASRRIRL